MKKVLFIPDTHRPYHDERAWKLVMKIAKDNNFHTIVVGGDFGEFYCTNAHRKDPNRNRHLEWEIKDINEGLDDLDSLKAKRKIFLQGNHEENLERYLIDRAPELFNVVTTKGLLKLDERGWEYYPYRRGKARVGKLSIAHDLGNSGPTAVAKALAGFQDNIVINHIHRMVYMIGGDMRGTKHVAASFGWLGDVNHIDYMDRDKAKAEWALGFGIGYLRDDGVVHLTPVPIINYTAVVEGRLYRV